VCPTATPKQYYVDEIPGAKYHWVIEGGTIVSDNTNNDTIFVLWSKDSAIHNLSVKAEFIPGCFTDTKYLNIDLSASAFVDIGDDVNICIGETHTFQPNYTYTYYKWQDSSFNSTFVGSKTQKIKLEVIDERGCIGRDSVNLYVDDEQVDLPGYTTLKKGGYLVLDAGIEDANYKWSTNETTKSIIVKYTDELAREIKVVVTTEFGCISTDSIVVYSNTEATTKSFPNAFTPNGDGQNDNWLIPVLEFYPNCSVTVYDRWGRSVFTAPKGYNKPWDGTYNGTPLPMASYFYIVNLNNGTPGVAGSVTIIR
jgi:gliding motility-associated-like protein